MAELCSMMQWPLSIVVSNIYFGSIQQQKLNRGHGTLNKHQFTTNTLEHNTKWSISKTLCVSVSIQPAKFLDTPGYDGYKRSPKRFWTSRCHFWSNYLWRVQQQRFEIKINKNFRQTKHNNKQHYTTYSLFLNFPARILFA